MNLHSRKTKRIIAAVIAILLVIALILPLALSVSAAQTQESGSRSALTSDTGYTVRSGITLNGTDISGRRISDVKASIEQELSEKQGAVITLLGAEEGQAVTVSAGNLGLRWTNPEVIDQISGYGRGANIIARYKEQKDIEKYGANYYVETSFNEDMIRTFIERNCTAFDVKGTEPTLVRENGVFHATDGTNGMMVDVDASTADVYSYLTNEWDGRDASLDLDHRRGSREPHRDPGHLYDQLRLLRAGAQRQYCQRLPPDQRSHGLSRPGIFRSEKHYAFHRREWLLSRRILSRG